MGSLQLSQLHISWNEETWLDTGILFPFFNKQIHTDVLAWGQYLLGAARKNKFFTTKLAAEEVKRTWTRWHPQSRKLVCALYRELFNEMTICDCPASEQGTLSAADISLANRDGNGLLITSDRNLYELDKGPTCLVAVHSNGYQHYLKMRWKGDRGE